jgi:hypothetical protein
MVIRINPKGYCLHIYLHRFAVVLSTIQISSAVAARQQLDDGSFNG